MNTKIFLFLSLVFLTSCGQQTSDLPGTLPENESTADYSRALDNVSQKVQSTPEFQSCLESSILSCKNSSVMQTAERTGDIEYCSELGDNASIDNCRFSLTVTSAMRNLDASGCSVLSDIYLKNCQKQVYKLKAMKELNGDICDLMITSTGSTVKKEERMEVQECLLGVILANTGSIEKDCDKIGDAEIKKNCQITLQQR